MGSPDEKKRRRRKLREVEANRELNRWACVAAHDLAAAVEILDTDPRAVRQEPVRRFAAVIEALLSEGVEDSSGAVTTL
jgi:hypothetical protein